MFPNETIMALFPNETRKEGEKMRKALLNARIERNLTQEEVAQKAGISRSAYTNIERGVKNPSFDVAVRIKRPSVARTTIFF